MSNQNSNYINLHSLNLELIPTLFSCIAELKSPSSSQTTNSYVITPSQPITFSFSKKYGLYRSSNHSMLSYKDDLLAQILTLDDSNNFEAYGSFFNKNGYWFPLLETSEVFEDEIKKSCHLIATLSRLLSQFQSYAVNYNQLLLHFIDLLHTEEITSNFVFFKTPLLSKYLTKPFEYGKGPNAMSYHLPAWIEFYPIYNRNEIITVYDTISKKNISIDTKLFFKSSTEINSEHLIDLLFFSKVTEEDTLSKCTIDFLYNLHQSFPDINLLQEKNMLLNLKLSPQQKNILYNLSKEYLEYYITQAWSRTIPEITLFSPTTVRLHADNLFSLCIGSLLAYSQDNLTHRKCNYALCGNYYITSQNNYKRKYCCTSCQENAKSKRYRDKYKGFEGDN